MVFQDAKLQFCGEDVERHGRFRLMELAFTSGDGRKKYVPWFRPFPVDSSKKSWFPYRTLASDGEIWISGLWSRKKRVEVALLSFDTL